MEYRAQPVWRSGAIVFAIAAIAFMPTFANARENKAEWRNEKKEMLEEWKQERKEQREEWKKEWQERRQELDKMLLEKRWWKDNGLHLGWYKKWPWWKDHPTTTPQNDNDAPDIDDLKASSVRARSATITWETDERARSIVYYSTSSSVDLNSDSTKKAVEGGWFTDHEMTIGGLSPTTTYHAFVVSKDSWGNTSTSSKISFTTTGAADMRAPRISDIRTDVGTSTITIKWKTDEPATSRVYYQQDDLTSTSSASSIGDSDLVTDHSLAIRGLSDDTDYHLRIESRDAAGNVRLGNEFSLETDED